MLSTYICFTYVVPINRTVQFKQ
uniref:Uncharacterized protein n=1 Tax=Arundo donax TaxID=35708 RepID=A0A0A9AFQ4_ARUDO